MLQSQQAAPVDLCDAARDPHDGQLIQAHGTFLPDRHGSLFVGDGERCSVAMTMDLDAPALDVRTFYMLSMWSSPIGRVEAVVEGRLVWVANDPGRDHRSSYWMLKVLHIRDAAVIETTPEAWDAYWKTVPKVIGLEPVRD